MRTAVAGLVALLVVGILASAGGQERSSDGGSTRKGNVTCHTEMTPMRDGTLLATDVYLPAASGRYPVILERTPYGLRLGHGCFRGISGEMAFWAENGYVALTQDSRGTFRSQGMYNPFFQEQNDGYDAVEWAAAQPWSNGKAALTGTSYFGVTQWQAAVTAPPHLVAIAPGQTATDYHDHWTYVNGVFDLWFAQSWLLNFFAPDAYRRELIAKGTATEEARKASDEYLARGKRQIFTSWSKQVPLTSFQEFRTLAPYYYEWLKHPDYDDYWAAIDVEKRWGTITVPAFVNGGWSDLFAVGSIRGFNGMKAAAGSATARAGSKLVMYPGGHGGTGALTFDGAESVNLRALQLRFYDHYVKGLDNGVDREPAVRLFVQSPPDGGARGGGWWLTSDSFPPPEAKKMGYSLRSAGHANTRSGDGVLDAQGAPSGPPDTFTYDPVDPVPSHGGGLCCTSLGFYFGSGAQEQSPLELRKDVLVFTGPPLTADLTVVGPVTFTFWAKSSARDTDFTVKLVDVRPDGFAYNVLDRVVRTRFRNGSKSKPELIEPNTAYKYEVELGNTAIIFKAGHRLRLDISSSKFPQLARNPNTGADVAQEGRLIRAVQTVLHDAGHPSRLELSVIPSAQRATENQSAGIPGRWFVSKRAK